MIAEMGLMNRRSTASLKVGPALVICLLVIMETAFLVSTYVMAIMIVWTIQMKMRGISAVSKSFNHRFLVFEHCQYVFIVPTLQFFYYTSIINAFCCTFLHILWFHHNVNLELLFFSHWYRSLYMKPHSLVFLYGSLYEIWGCPVNEIKVIFSWCVIPCSLVDTWSFIYCWTGTAESVLLHTMWPHVRPHTV
jgi:hypothetical protein